MFLKVIYITLVILKSLKFWTYHHMTLMKKIQLLHLGEQNPIQVNVLYFTFCPLNFIFCMTLFHLHCHSLAMK